MALCLKNENEDHANLAGFYSLYLKCNIFMDYRLFYIEILYVSCVDWQRMPQYSLAVMISQVILQDRSEEPEGPGV